jgi:mRNA interferase HigB
VGANLKQVARQRADELPALRGLTKSCETIDGAPKMGDTEPDEGDREEQSEEVLDQPGCGDARGPLHSWYDEAIKATWRSPQDVKDQYASASICGNNRVVFNIGGNKYRLVVEMQYRAGIAWVKFVGTYAQYDRIDVENVNDY